ncbi:MAG TPA: 1-aminocyclopropane-1-carboxylate deaminase, partial [Rhodospirillaceae bacterium]|nr:1-aminocyclopropane-1-carboxylate deaminase [Rhodospirillaceae bacterium]
MALKSSRRGDVSPFIVMEMLRFANKRVATGGDVLHLELGEPSAPTPQPVVKRVHELLDKNLPGYTESLGIPPLRERIAAYYQEREGVDVAPGRIAVTTGSSGAFVLAFLGAFDVGDRVALAVPGYPAYRNILTALGVETVALAVGPETRFQPTVEMLERVEGPLHGLIIASPS